MSPIAAAIRLLNVGVTRELGRLAVVPLLNSKAVKADYLLLDDAMQQGLVSIGEVSAAGSVPELRFENRAAKPVLVVDGEALVGAKQNRIANISVLVPPQSVIRIPVSCVERGRWQYRRKDFVASDHLLFSRSRASKAVDVTAALKASGSARSNQATIWSAIALKAERMASHSPSEAMEAIYAHHEDRLRDFEPVIKVCDNECGAVFIMEGHVVGMELFDSATTWKAISPKVLRSYALDALDYAASPRGERVSIHQWLERIVSAPVSQFPGVGLGVDVRIDDKALAGGALVESGRLVHCALFQ